MLDYATELMMSVCWLDVDGVVARCLLCGELQKIFDIWSS
jgi:hypothetical protein